MCNSAIFLILTDPPSTVVTAGQIAIAFLALFSFPLQLHPCRASVDKIWTQGNMSSFSPKRFKLITLGILVCSYLLSVNVKNLSTMLALVGATGSTTICYILPGLLYTKIRDNERQFQNTSAAWEPLQLAAVALAIYGVCVMTLSISAQLSDAQYSGH